MEKNVLGFVTVYSLVDNRPGFTSPAGELSTWSRTYSKSKGEYHDTTLPGISLTSFSVTDRSNGQEATLTAPEAQLALQVAKHCLDYSSQNPLPLDPEDFRNSIQATMYGQIQSLEFGNLVTTVPTPLPSWFTFRKIGEDEHTYFIWFADDRFRADYPEYDITVIDPVPNLTVLTGAWSEGVDVLNQWPLTRILEKAQVEKNNNPETYTRCMQYDFINPSNPTQKIPVNWLVLVYGEAGNDEDIIKEAIANRLLDIAPESTWSTRFPDIFKRTEFLIYPRWDRLSVPNVSNLTALYSPMVNAKDAIDKAVIWADIYPSVFVRDNVNVFPLTYKSLTVTAVNGLSNVQEQENLLDLWPDYIAVGTSSPDFQRMQPLTQDWVHFMIRLISEAETSGHHGTLGNGFKRVQRGSKTYLSGAFNNAKYFVLTRQSYLDSVA